MGGFDPYSYGGSGPRGLGWQGWENAAGQSIGPGGAWDENTIYSNDYSGTIPEGAGTADLGGQRQRGMYSSTTAQGLYERAQGGDPAAVAEYQQYVSRYYPNWGTQGGGGQGSSGSGGRGGNWGGNQGGGGQGTFGQYGGGGGGGGGGQTFGWGGNVNFPGSTTTIGQPGGPDPRQGGGRMQPQDQAQPWGNGGATDPYLGGGWGGQTDPPQGGQGPRMSTQSGGYGQPDPMQGGWGGTRPSMAGRMLGSMFGQRR